MAKIDFKYFFSLVSIFFILGFPVDPFFGIPLVFFIIPFYFCEVRNFVVLNFSIFCLFLFFGLFFLIFGMLSYFFGDGNFQDLRFLFIIFIKVGLNFFSGIILYNILRYRPFFIFIWIFIQSTLIFLSIFFEYIYSILVHFISPASAGIFELLYGLRGLGFGIYHVDGAIILCFSLAYISLIAQTSWVNKFFLQFPGWIFSLALARSALIPIILRFLLKNQLVLVVFVIVFFCGALFLDATDGVLYQAIEPFKNMLEMGSPSIQSTNANVEMFFFPSGFLESVSGVGKFFDGEGFYRGTDLGWIRLTLFGGYIISGLYFLINCIWLLFSFSRNKKLNFFSFFILMTIVVLNFKGLVFSTPFAVVAYMHSKEK